jgi:L-erythrulose 1-phosphate isomerase
MPHSSPVWIGTSWKMNKTGAEGMAFAARLAKEPSTTGIQRFVIPPFTSLREVKRALAQADVKLGAQNMHWADAGAWTGEI